MNILSRDKQIDIIASLCEGVWHSRYGASYQREPQETVITPGTVTTAMRYLE